MSPKEEKVYNETRKRNLKRRLSRLSQHPDMTEEYLEVKNMIKELDQD